MDALLSVTNSNNSSSELLQVIKLTIQVSLARYGAGFGLALADISKPNL